MGLSFGAMGSDRVALAAAMGLGNAFSLAFIVKMAGFSDGAHVIEQLTTSGVKRAKLSGTTGDVEIRVRRTGSAAAYTTNTTPLAASGAWRCLGITYDEGAAAGQIFNIYAGPLFPTSSIAECTYSSTSDSSGATDTESGAGLISNLSAFDAGLGGIVADFMAWTRVLTLDEFKQWFAIPRVLGANGLLFHRYGWNGQGTGTQSDFTGNGKTGTVTGATQADHPIFASLQYYLRSRRAT